MVGKLIGAVLAAGVVLSSAGMAQAQTYNWSGPYAGVSLGGAWGSSSLASSTDCPAANGYYCQPTAPATTPNPGRIANAASGSTSTSSFIAGGQLGYNWQAGALVYGIEADLSSFDLGSSVGGVNTWANNAAIRFAAGSSISSDWLATLRGRIGMTIQPNLLAYFTVGLAFTDLEVRNGYSDNNGTGGIGGTATSELITGLALGGGLEYGLSRNWTLRGDYMFVDFGSVRTNSVVTNAGIAGSPTNLLTTSGDLSAHLARVGLNYKF